MKKLFFIILLLSLSIQAQVDRSKKPEAGPAPEIKIAEYESFTLENGLQVFVVENHKLPKVSFSLILDRDPIIEGDNAGYISLTGQLLRRGTKNRTKDEIDEQVDFIGASLSTSATGVFASSLTKHKEKIIDLMADVIINSEFKQEELDKLKLQTKSALAQAKEDPDAVAGNVFQTLIYGKDHPYGEVETEETIESISLDICADYYKKYFRPNIAYLAVVGDINKNEAEELVKKYLASWEKSEVPNFEYKKPRQPIVNKVALVDRPASVQSVISIGYPVDLPKGSDDVIKASVLNTILGGSFTSRLNHNLREDKGYTYGIGSSLSSDELVGRFITSTTVRNEVTDSAITEILKEMKNIVKEKVTDEELQSTKNYITGSFARSLESPQTVATFALNTARYKLAKDYYKNYLKNLNSVSIEDIQNTAKKYIKPNNSYILVVSNADQVAEGLKQFSASDKITYYDNYGNEIIPESKKIPDGINAENIIEKYIEAIGGRDKVENINSKIQKMSGKSGALELTVTVMQKNPNKFKQKLESNIFTQTTMYDGENGKRIQMGQEFILEGKDLEDVKMQAVLNPYLDYNKYGIKTELGGIENINGKDNYKLILTLPNDEKWIHYFDIESGLMTRFSTTVNAPQGSFVQNIDYSDYRDVHGIKFPFKIFQQTGPRAIEMEVHSIEINKDIDDKEFKIE